MTTDVTVLQNAINGGFRPIVRGPVMLVMGVGLSFWMNAQLWRWCFLSARPSWAAITVLYHAQGGADVWPAAGRGGPC